MTKTSLTVIPGRRLELEMNFIRKVITPEGVSQDDIDRLKPKGKLSVVSDLGRCEQKTPPRSEPEKT